MNLEIIAAIISAIATIVAAAIGGLVAIKVKDMELVAKEARTGERLTQAEKKAAHWLWGIVGAGIVIVVMAVSGNFLFFPPPETSWIQCNGEIVHIEESFFYVNELATCQVSLAESEFIVGTVDRFQENVNKPSESTPCTAYLIKGPIETSISLWYGGGDYYPVSNTYTDEFLETQLKKKFEELKKHDTCPFRAEGEYDIRILSSKSWQHNPTLPPTAGYPGYIQTSNSSSLSGYNQNVEFEVSNQQMLMVFGSQGYFAEIGQLGGTSDCFLVVTRGPFNSKMDLQEAGLEIHDVHSNASSIIWASEKVKDLQQEHPETCKHGVDLWIGEAL